MRKWVIVASLGIAMISLPRFLTAAPEKPSLPIAQPHLKPSVSTGDDNITETLQKEALPQLMQSLTDQKKAAHLRVRRIAGDVHDHEATLYLFQAYEQTEATGIRCKILESIGKFHDPEAFKWLTRRLEDPDVGIQCFVIWAMGELKDPRSAAILQPKLWSPNRYVQMTTIDALGKVGRNWNVASELETFLTEDDVQLRYLAAKALVATAGPDAVPLLAERLMQEPSLEVQEALARAIGHAGDSVGVGRLIELLKNSPSQATEHWAETGLKAAEASVLVPALAPMLNGEDFRLKVAAARILREMEISSDEERNTGWMEPVMRWAQGSDPVVRDSAQGLIERIKAVQ
jgi:HEAT repeat protein